MSRTKTIGVDALLSVTTGRLLCDSFGRVQEVGDFLTGQSTWTHMYGSEWFADRIANELKRQHPWTADEVAVLAEYPDLSGLSRDEVEAAITAWLETHIYPKHGRTVVIEPEPEPIRVPFGTGLENLGANRR